MYSDEKILIYKRDQLSNTFGFYVENNHIYLDNTAEERPETLQVLEDDTDAQIYCQRNACFILTRDHKALTCKILFSRNNVIETKNISWNRSKYKLPAYKSNEDESWISLIGLMLVSDMERGTTTFDHDFNRDIFFIMREINLTAYNKPLERKYTTGGIKLCLDKGVFYLRTLKDETLYTTSDFKNISLSRIQRLLFRLMKTAA